jgi:translation initiation factor 4A
MSGNGNNAGNTQGAGGANNSNNTPASKAEVIEVSLGQEGGNFDDLNLKPELLKAINNAHLDKPNAVHHRAIQIFGSGKDLILQGQSVTGKAAVFSISALQRIDEKTQDLQALLLAPTRELAKEIHNVLKSLGDQLNVKSHLCIGGNRVDAEQRELEQQPPQVVVGTPGRVNDLIHRGSLKTQNIKVFVIDEADVMLFSDMQAQVFGIFNAMPKGNAQVFLLTAHLPSFVRNATRNLLRDPVRIMLKDEHLSLQSVRQFCITAERDQWKFDTLCQLIDTVKNTPIVIFCNSRATVAELTRQLTGKGLQLAHLHGGMSETQRDQNLEQFRSSGHLLVTTDLFAHNADVQQKAKVVVNYEMPINREGYIHRVGRSSRPNADSDVVAVSFIATRDTAILEGIKRAYDIELMDHLPEEIGKIMV